MNIFNSTSSFLKRLRYGATIDPVRDWLTVLIFSTIVLTGIIVWNIWAFDTIASGGSIGAPAPKTSPLFNRASLDAIHAIFEKRAAEETKYQTGIYRYADPSQ
jgi:hypothetical protein